ncbi:Cob(I)alamin adenosyltransferase [Hydrogenimonas sp.]|nr:Cob(I)alamin adenosyltransferase [Hydrogenimonas sp.]
MVQLYTGEGKGKTTAAVGLTLRAMGNGWKVLFVQFMKGRRSGETEMLERCGGGNLKTLRNWDGSFVLEGATPEQIGMVEELFASMQRELEEFQPDLLVLDEVVVAVTLGLLPQSRLLDFLKSRPESVEAVMTGRGATEEMVQMCDLVTEMRKIKHYYDRGIEAREGIEY